MAIAIKIVMSLPTDNITICSIQSLTSGEEVLNESQKTHKAGGITLNRCVLIIGDALTLANSTISGKQRRRRL
jgi:hypothetical protein